LTRAYKDCNGEYELKVESLQGTIVVSYIGYKTKEVHINIRTELDIELESQTIAGEEMVVTGYREVEKEKLTSSISRVSSEQLENTPRENPIHSIQGNAPGVRVSKSNGQPGSPVNVHIREIGRAH